MTTTLTCSGGLEFTDEHGTAVVLGTPLGRAGGEGTVYEVIDEPALVAKVYHHPPGEAKIAKLEHLCALGTPAVQSVAAFPTGLLSSEGEPCGYLMRLARGREIHQLFGPKERSIEFPSARWDFLVHVARNCAAAFGALHALGVVIGDVNEGNVLVDEEGGVTLIDCDSYQVTTPRRVLTCDVGIEHWTPPELQGTRTFSGVERTVNHDLFGLALLVFKLLFMGRHPFAGVPAQAQEMMIEQAIAEHLFAFSPRAWPRGIQPPPHCLMLAHLPPAMGALFEAAFLAGSERGRPDAARWASALEELEKGLISCAADPSHRYARTNAACPWCAIIRAGGPNFFLNVDLGPALHCGPDATDLWARIANQPRIRFRLLQPRDLLLPVAVGRPVPPDLLAHRTDFLSLWLLLAGGAVCFMGNVWLAAAVGALVMAVFLARRSWHRSLGGERDRRQAALDGTCVSLAGKLAEMNAIPGRYQADFEARKRELKTTYDRLVRIDNERSRRLRKLHRHIEKMQRQDFLDRQLLSHAELPGFTLARLGALLAYGVESAGDIRAGLRVPGLTPALEHRLFGWRQECEARFHFDATRGIPGQELHRLDLGVLELRRTLIAELESGPKSLAKLGTVAAEQVKRCERRIADLLTAQAQARADWELVAR